MANRVETVVPDLRQHKRVKENKEISWSLTDKTDIQGNGRIVNISESGLLLETNSNFVPQNGETFNFNTSTKQFDYLPAQGRIIWSKKKDGVENHYLCGVEFTNSTEDVRVKLAEHVNVRIKGEVGDKKWSKALGILLTLTIACLTIFSLWVSKDIYTNLNTSTQSLIVGSQKQAILTNTYHTLYKETKEKLIATEQELETTRGILQVITQDLESTKSILAETENLLNQTQSSNSSLKNEISSLTEVSEQKIQALRAELEGKIGQLEAQNASLKAEVAALQDQVRYFEGNVKSLDEGKLFLSTYKDRVRLVKEKIKVFKSEAEQVRRKAMRDRDRLLMELGNNGYFVKNGQAVKVDTEKYNAVSNGADVSDIAEPARTVDVNVKIVE